jgi:hypothetical protein
MFVKLGETIAGLKMSKEPFEFVLFTGLIFVKEPAFIEG